jgi:hypothetical protein
MSALQAASLAHVDRILDMQKYNGRVSLVVPEDPDVRFRMFEKTTARNRATEYRGAVDSIWESNPMAQAYFSSQNVQIIQNALRAQVYKRSDGKFVLPNQNLDALKIVMRSIYLQNARHSPDDIPGQIAALNEMVLDYAVDYCYNEAVSYVKYLQDQSSLVVPLERELPHDREFKQLEMKPFI